MLASGGFEWNADLRPRVPARPDDPPGVDRDEHRRRPADGDEGRSDDHQHARGVVDPRRRRARGGQPARADPGQRAADAAALDHGQPARPAVHQRGGELQRLRRRLPRRGRLPVRVRQPAVLAGVRPERTSTRYGFRVAAGGGGGQVPAWIPRGDTPAELAAVVGIDGEELERTVERWNAAVRRGPRPRLRPRRQRLRLLVGRPAPQGPARRHARPARRAARSTPTRSTAARSARRAGRGSIPTLACSTSTATRSRVCTPPAT